MNIGSPPRSAPDAQKLLLHKGAGLRIEGGEWFVQQQDFGIVDESAGDGDALAHAAR